MPSYADARLTSLARVQSVGQETAQASASAIQNTFKQPEGTTASAVPGAPDLAVLNIAPAVAGQVARIADQARRAQEQIDCLASLPQYADEQQLINAGPAWDVLARRQHDATIQPPKPEIVLAQVLLRPRAIEQPS